MTLFNRCGLVLLARRFKNDGPEVIEAGLEWQMPQGGIHENEKPLQAALRELFEETGVFNTEYLGQTGWMSYEFPPYFGSQDHRLARYRGQRQKWYAFRFTGIDAEIDVTVERNGEPPEFDSWKWEKLAAIPATVVPYKHDVYTRIVRSFSRFEFRSQK